MLRTAQLRIFWKKMYQRFLEFKSGWKSDYAMRKIKEPTS